MPFSEKQLKLLLHLHARKNICFFFVFIVIAVGEFNAVLTDIHKFCFCLLNKNCRKT